jgi:hypothetical protein
MSETLALLAIGLLLLFGLLSPLRQTESTGDERLGQSLEDSSAAAVRFADRRKEILSRIFDGDDWDFVVGHASKEIRRLFLYERKKIALCWLSEIRSQAKAAMDFHVSHARRSKKLVPMLELKLAVDYFSIRLKCGLIALFLLLKGPMALRRMVGHACQLSDQLRGLLEVALQTESFPEKARVSEP